MVDWKNKSRTVWASTELGRRRNIKNDPITWYQQQIRFFIFWLGSSIMHSLMAALCVRRWNSEEHIKQIKLITFELSWRYRAMNLLEIIYSKACAMIFDAFFLAKSISRKNFNEFKWGKKAINYMKLIRIYFHAKHVVLVIDGSQ